MSCDFDAGLATGAPGGRETLCAGRSDGAPRGSGALAGQGFRKRPPFIDCGLDLFGGAWVAEPHGYPADAFDRQQRAPDTLGHQIGEIHRAPTGQQAQRYAGMAGAQLQRAHKTQIEDRLVQLRVEDLRQPVQNGRTVIAGGEFSRYAVAHDPRTSDILLMTGCPPTQCAAAPASSTRPCRRPMRSHR